MALVEGGATQEALGQAEAATTPAPVAPPVQPAPEPAEAPVEGQAPAPVLKAGGAADTALTKVKEANPEGGLMPGEKPINPVDLATMQARAAGYSWSEIGDYIDAASDKAIASGYSQKEVSDFLGYENKDRPLFGKGPTPTEAPEVAEYNAGAALLKSGAQYVGSAITHPGDLVSGLEMSSGGMLLKSAAGVQNPGQQIAPMDESEAAIRAQQIGELLGDTPVAIVGGALGAVAGGALTVGNPVGVAAGAMFGMSALPAYLRSHYADQMLNGPYKSGLDFANRAVATTVEAFTQGAAGIPAGILGPVAGRIAGPIARIAVEGSTLAGMSAAIEGHLPSMQEVLDSTLQIAAMHGVANLPRLGGTIRDNVVRHWSETGEMPSAQVEHARSDPSFAQSLMMPARPELKPGSSVTVVEIDGQIVIQSTKTPGPIAYTPDQVGQDLIDKIDRKETGGLANPDAAVSRTGAIGKAQIEPSTAKQYGFDPDDLHDPKVNAAAQRAILSDLSKRFQGEEKAIMIAYNAGPKWADRWIAAGRDDSILPEETKGYIKEEPNRPSEPSLVGHAGAGAATPSEIAGTLPEYKPPTFEDAFREIGVGITDPPVPTTRERLNSWFNTAYRTILNPSHPLEKIQRAADDGTPLTDMQNPRVLRQMVALSDGRAEFGLKKAQIDLKGKEVGPSFEKIIEPIRSAKEAMEYEVYAKARWGLMMAGLQKESGVRYDEAQVVYDKLHAKYGPIFDQIIDFRNNSLGLLRDGGLIPAKYHDALVANHKTAVPAYRVKDNAPKEARLGPRGLQPSKPIKHLDESDLKTRPSLQSVVSDHYARTRAAFLNMHAVAQADIARELGVSRKAEAKMTHSVLTDRDIAQLGANEGADRDIFRKEIADVGPNDVLMWRDGKPVVEHFDSPEAAYAMKGEGMDLRSTAKLLGPISKANSVMRAGVALNPLFAVRNLIYDIPMRASVNGVGKTIKSLYSGIGPSFGLKPKVWREFLKTGGAETAHAFLSQDYVKDVLAGRERSALGRGVWNALTSVPRALQAWNQNVMSIMPAGRFASGVASGETPMTAGAAASQFRLHSKTYGGALGRLFNTQIPFFLAHANGMEQTLRAMTGNTNSAVDSGRSAMAFHVTATAMFTAPVLAQWFADKDKEWYKAAPEWQKNNGLLFNVGSEKSPTVVYLPFPPLIGMIYGGLPRMLAEKFAGDNPGQLTAGSIASSALASAMPPGFLMLGGLGLTAAQFATNHSFLTGRPIVPDSMKERLPQEQAYPWSSGVARTLSAGLSHLGNLGSAASPIMIDNLIGQLFGTLGKEAVAATDTLFGTGAHSPTSPTSTWSDFPGLSSFLTRYPSASAEPTTTFMDRTAEMTASHNSIEAALQEGDVDRAIDILKTPLGLIKGVQLRGQGGAVAAAALSPAAQQKWSQAYEAAVSNRSPDTIAAAQEVVMDQKQVDAARNAAKVAAAMAGLSRDDKRQIMDQAYLQMQKFSEAGNKALNRIGAE